MEHRFFLKTVRNEEGFVLVTGMLVLMILVIIGISATRTTTLEKQIAMNDKFLKEDFYDQESCLTNGLFLFRTWLTPAFLTTAETTAYFPAAGGADVNGNGINDASECFDSNGVVIGSFKVRDLESTGTNIANWEDLVADFNNDPTVHPANNVPPLSHKDKPDPGSGYDPKNFEIRRFAVTSYSPDRARKVVLQQGVYKVFNKF